jgi:hypothetical protein
MSGAGAPRPHLRARESDAARAHDEEQAAQMRPENWPPPDPPDPYLSGVLRVADVSVERVVWEWAGRLPQGKLVVLDGDPGLGKSNLTLDWAARVTTGSPWPDGTLPAMRGGVVLLSAEDGIADTIRPRLAAAGGDLQRAVVLDSMPTFDAHGLPGPRRPPLLPDDLPTIARIARDELALLIIIDPLMVFLSSRVDAHRDQDVRAALAQLSRLASDSGACVVVIRHLNKSGGGHAIYRGGGSIGIIGASRVGLLVGAHPEEADLRVLSVTKCNLAPEAASLGFRLIPDELHHCSRVAWEGEVSLTADQLLALPEDSEERSKVDEAVAFLHALLAEGPVPAKDVFRAAHDCGIAERTLNRAKKTAGAESVKSAGFGAGAWVWRLVNAPEWTGSTGPNIARNAEDVQPAGLATFGDLATFGSLPGTLRRARTRPTTCARRAGNR